MDPRVEPEGDIYGTRASMPYDKCTLLCKMCWSISTCRVWSPECWYTLNTWPLWLSRPMGSPHCGHRQDFLRGLLVFAGLTLDASTDIGVGLGVLTKPTLEKLTNAVGA